MTRSSLPERKVLRKRRVLCVWCGDWHRGGALVSARTWGHCEGLPVLSCDQAAGPELAAQPNLLCYGTWP